eukprot:TRINITY_DN8676_c0_g3_i1.p1 TRINITY_DN8676_c0_g3~~TRINITY_DN8676_c0_g3_i1.p1  ORF type:complete len:381 (+),score=69.73 TRINITY_DN8676_c0_g3_i1:107-1249(+)
MASKAAARRVARDLTREYRVVPATRKEVSYRGGLFNCTQKLQWFWFSFKKYGFLQNLANIVRMREAWWESGEKRLVGMDAQGHRYWETDEMGRKWSGGFRWLDYPYHLSWHDWSRIPDGWSGWARMHTGRSPPQMEALHKELGPAWRDYLKNHSWNSGFSESQKDFWMNPQGMDTSHRGNRYFDPWSPDFKKNRRHYGHSLTAADPGSIYLNGNRNLYDIDEYNPDGGAKGKLEVTGLGPDAHGQRMMSQYTDENLCKINKFMNPMTHSHSMKYEEADGGESTSAIWWDYRKTQGKQTKESRASVSAFDDPVQSPLNKTNEIFAFENRYMHASDKALGYARSTANPKNHKFCTPLDNIQPELFQAKHRMEHNHLVPDKNS